MRVWRFGIWVLLGGTAGWGCHTPHASTVSNPASAPTSDALYVSPQSFDFSDNSQLLDRLRSGPHGYFRFVNVAFAESVCQRLSPDIQAWPSVNLHGDAHLEQYAVTDLGRGLTDFDDSTTGPAAIDLLRFGVSIRLACRERGWEAEADRLYARFLEGYRAALEDTALMVKETALSRRVRKKFESDRKKYLAWIDSLMESVSQEQQDMLIEAMRPYTEAMHRQHADLPQGFFAPVKVGLLRLGIGSALDRKYLIRVQGPSKQSDDDVILEAKEVRDLSGISCIATPRRGDPLRIIVGQSRIAYAPHRFLGYLRAEGRVFWIHSWVDNYQELRIAQSLESPDDLAEVVYDVGAQLGRGHPNKIAAPVGDLLRGALIEMLDKHTQLLDQTGRAMTLDLIEAWQRFRSEVSKSGPGDQDSTEERDKNP